MKLSSLVFCTFVLASFWTTAFAEENPMQPNPSTPTDWCIREEVQVEVEPGIEFPCKGYVELTLDNVGQATYLTRPGTPTTTTGCTNPKVKKVFAPWGSVVCTTPTIVKITILRNMAYGVSEPKISHLIDRPSYVSKVINPPLPAGK